MLDALTYRMEICCLEFPAHTTGEVHCSRTSFRRARCLMTSSGIILQLSLHYLTAHCQYHQLDTTLISVRVDCYLCYHSWLFIAFIVFIETPI